MVDRPVERATRPARPSRLLVFGDASSIHTEHWVKGLVEAGPVELMLLTMNPAGIRDGLRDLEELKAIHEVYSGRVDARGRNWRYLRNVPKIRGIVRQTKPDAIVALYLSSYGLLAALCKGRAALAQIILGSDVMTTPNRSPWYRIAARWSLARGDLIVSPSREATQRVLRLSKGAEHRIMTQQYGLEDWIFEERAGPVTRDFVSNRAWVANSRIPLLLDIFSRVRTTSRLRLIGAGEEEDAIHAIASRDARVSVLGQLPHRENIATVAGAGFYISMTASDGASLSLLEAMAVGAIPAVSDIEPNREWVEDGVNGVLLPEADVERAASRVEWLLSRSPEELLAMRARNRALVEQRGNRRTNMAAFRRRLDAAVAAREGRLR